MTAKELVDGVRREFFGRLNRKTGWGRNELKLEFEGAVLDALIEEAELSPEPDLINMSVPEIDEEDCPF